MTYLGNIKSISPLKHSCSGLLSKFMQDEYQQQLNQLKRAKINKIRELIRQIKSIDENQQDEQSLCFYQSNKYVSEKVLNYGRDEMRYDRENGKNERVPKVIMRMQRDIKRRQIESSKEKSLSKQKSNVSLKKIR